MGQHIKPPERVVNEGRQIDAPKSWAAAQRLITPTERLVAVASRPFGKVALVIACEHDFLDVRRVGCDGLYIVSATLVDAPR